MSDDLLERATRALREQGGAEPPTDRSAFMRARLLSQAKRSSKLRPQSVWQWAAVIGLGFFVSTAMAQVIAVQLPRVIEALRSQPAPEPAKPKPAQPKPSKKALQPLAAAPEPLAPSVVAEPAAHSGSDEPAAPPEQVAAPAQPEQMAAPAQPEQVSAPGPTIIEPARRSQRGAPSPRRRESAAAKRSLAASIPAKPSRAPAEAVSEPAFEPAAAPAEPEPRVATASPPSPPPRAAAAEPAELALFRRAQALHNAHDIRAIAAWDSFLRVASTSVLAPEARYNRALGLVRAQRFDEARRALKPFAAGAYGSYRKDEAQALLARLPE